MSEYRDYDSGQLECNSKITLTDQLKNSQNCMYQGKLQLAQCLACVPEGDFHGRENHYSCVLSGICAWCGWGQERE